MTSNEVTLWIDVPGLLYELIAAQTEGDETVEEWLANPKNLRLGEVETEDGRTEIHTDGEFVIQLGTEVCER